MLTTATADFVRTNRHRMITRLLRSLNTLYDIYTGKCNGDLNAAENHGLVPKERCRISAQVVMCRCFVWGRLWPMPSSDAGLSLVELSRAAQDSRYLIETRVFQTCRCNSHITRSAHCPVQFPEDIGPESWENVERDLLHWDDLVSRLSREHHRYPGWMSSGNIEAAATEANTQVPDSTNFNETSGTRHHSLDLDEDLDEFVPPRCATQRRI